MKKMPEPPFNDVVAITETANNNRLINTSYPHLLNQLDLILEQYEHYLDRRGNALQIKYTR